MLLSKASGIPIKEERNLSRRASIRRMKNSLLLAAISCTVLLYGGCEHAGKSAPGKDPTKPVVLDFYLDTVSQISCRQKILAVNKFHQPYKSNNFYFMDDVSNQVFCVNTTSGAFYAVKKARTHLSEIETFILDENRHEIYFFTSDSVFVESIQDKRERIGFALNKAEQKGYLVTLNQNFPPILRKNKLYMHYFANVEETYQSQVFYRQPIEARLDLQHSKTTPLRQAYPEEYQSNCYGYNFSPDRFLVTNNVHGYSFPYDDTLYTYNVLTGQKENFFFGSKRKTAMKSISYARIKRINDAVFDAMYHENESYGFSGGAPLAGCFYRHLLSKTKDDKKSVSLIVFDKNLRYLGESKPDLTVGIIADSENGLSSISLDIEKQKIYLCRVRWKS